MRSSLHHAHQKKLLFTAELIYLVLVVTIKLSFLVFYARIFHPSRAMKWLARFGMAGIVLFNTAIFFRSAFACKPVKKIWTPFEPGTCIEREILACASGFFNVFSDLYILVLPMPFIWSLKTRTSKKLKLTMAFGVGLM